MVIEIFYVALNINRILPTLRPYTSPRFAFGFIFFIALSFAHIFIKPINSPAKLITYRFYDHHKMHYPVPK